MWTKFQAPDKQRKAVYANVIAGSNSCRYAGTRQDTPASGRHTMRHTIMGVLPHDFKLWGARIGRVVLIGLLLIVAGCRSEPGATPAPPTPITIAATEANLPPPEILGFAFTPSNSVPPGARIGIQVNVNRNGHKINEYRWIVSAGEGRIVNGQGTPLVTYQAPETPGSYQVRVELEYDGGPPVRGSTTIEVMEPPTPTPIPTPSNTPIPTPEPSPVTSTPTPEPPPTPIPTPDAVVVYEGGLNLRSGPGVIYDPPIGYLSYGEALTVTGRITSNKWIQVISVADPDKSGWASGLPQYVQINADLVDIPIVEAPSTPTPTKPLLASPPTLLEPPNGTNIALHTRLDLAWQWDNTTLDPEDDRYFQVEIWNRYNDFQYPIDVAWVKGSPYKYDRIDEAYDREYRWRITVVRGTPAGEKPWSTPENPVWEPGSECPGSQCEMISEPSDVWTLYVEPGTTPVPTPTRGRERERERK